MPKVLKKISKLARLVNSYEVFPQEERANQDQ
jgi:hypothetical protein